jgi:DNA mismatch endonuclease (patch repair protein)
MSKVVPPNSFDPLTPHERSVRMSLIRSKNTKPELIVRRLAWSMGYRYRLHLNSLPGRPDLAFLRIRKAIFVHGCFWHQHKRCKHYVMPKSRLSFWLPKLESNVSRDKKHLRILRSQGWEVLVVWECQLKDIRVVSRRIRKFLEGP